MTAPGRGSGLPPGSGRKITTWVAIGLLALGVIGSATAPKKAGSVKTAGSTSSTNGSSSSSVDVSTTTQDPDEVTDPSASGATPPPAAATALAVDPTSCRSGDPLANVYHTTRLHVIKPCTTVTGTVAAVRHEDDGDYHINLNLDPAYAGLINDRNTSGEHGALVVEIVPADEPGCTVGQSPKAPAGTYDYGTCTGADEIAPRWEPASRSLAPMCSTPRTGGWRSTPPGSSAHRQPRVGQRHRQLRGRPQLRPPPNGVHAAYNRAGHDGNRWRESDGAVQ